MVACITCQNMHAGSTKADKEMTRMGFVSCYKKPNGMYTSVNFERECKDHQPAPADKVAKRVEFYESLKNADRSSTPETSRQGFTA